MTHTVDNGQHLIDKPSTGYKDKMAKMVELEADLAPSSH